IADKSVIPDLADVIRGDQDDLVRITAIEAMVSFKSRDSLDVLYETAHNLRNPKKVVTAASLAIGQIRGYSR
ncbi:MAG: HEAT repeat domain-containing protein, partial [Candidatus Heimdallarchaeota archaeon]